MLSDFVNPEVSEKQIIRYLTSIKSEPLKWFNSPEENARASFIRLNQ
jgi:hypothetical protein